MLQGHGQARGSRVELHFEEPVTPVSLTIQRLKVTLNIINT